MPVPRPFLLAVWWPALAWAAPPTVSLPVEHDFASAGGVALEVFVPGDTLHVRSSASCKLTDPSGAARSLSSHASGDDVYTFASADREGTWTVACGTTEVTKVRVVLASSAHRHLWLGHETPEALAAKYAKHPPDVTRYQYGPQSGDGAEWVRRAGWHYVLNAANPNYTDGGTARCENGDAGPCSVPGQLPSLLSHGSPATTPASSLSKSHPGKPMERIALSHLLAQAWLDGGYTTDARLTEIAESGVYLQAAKYWGLWFATMSDASWDGLNDLYKSRLLISMAVVYDWLWPDLTHEERSAWLAGLVRFADDYYADPSHGFAWADDGVYAGKNWREARLAGYDTYASRILRNGHTWERYVAIGVTTVALERELCAEDAYTGTCAAEPYATWNADVDETIAALFDELGRDGGDHQGVDYWQNNFAQLLRYLDAAWSVPNGEEWDGYEWPHRAARYLDHLTMPNGDRSLLGDSFTSDWDGPSNQMSLLARYLGAGDPDDDALLAQWWAWEGRNDATSPTQDDEGMRDVTDLLWFDESAPAERKVGTHECFAEAGIVSLRGNLDEDAVQLVLRARGLLGAHGFPDVGSFSLYHRGYLVDFEGSNQEGKRTLSGSTLLVDGYGQHADGMAHTDAAPEGTTARGARDNHGRMLAYLDNRGVAWDGRVVDVAGVATRLTDLYTYDAATDDDRAGDRASWTAKANGTDRRLDDLSRYVVWIGDPDPDADGAGAVLLYDRVQATIGAGDPFQVRWNLATSERDADGARPSCTAKTYSGDASYYAYEGPSGTTYVRLRYGASTLPETKGGASVTMSDLNRDWTPALPSDAACEPTHLPATVAGTSSVDVTPAHDSGGWLRVVSLDGSAFEAPRPFAGGTGGALVAHHLVREQDVTRTGAFLTALLPAGPGGAPAPITSLDVAGGRLVQVPVRSGADEHVATALFTLPGYPLARHGLTTVHGAVGVVAHGTDRPRDRYAAQMLVASRLDHQGTTLLRVTDRWDRGRRASVGVTYGDTAVYGVIQGVPTGSISRVEIYVPPEIPDPTVVEYSGRLQGKLWNAATRTMRLDVTTGGELRLRVADSPVEARVQSRCTLE